MKQLTTLVLTIGTAMLLAACSTSQAPEVLVDEHGPYTLLASETFFVEEEDGALTATSADSVQPQSISRYTSFPRIRMEIRSYSITGRRFVQGVITVTLPSNLQDFRSYKNTVVLHNKRDVFLEKPVGDIVIGPIGGQSATRVTGLHPLASLTGKIICFDVNMRNAWAFGFSKDDTIGSGFSGNIVTVVCGKVW